MSVVRRAACVVRSGVWSVERRVSRFCLMSGVCRVMFECIVSFHCVRSGFGMGK